MAVESDKLTELKKYAWQLSCSGKTTKQICKLVNRKPRTVDRWLAESKQNLPINIINKDNNAEKLAKLAVKAWDGIDELLLAASTPANVKAMLYIRILNSQGYMVEKKEIKHEGGIDMNIDFGAKRKSNINQGVKAFNVIDDNS